MKLAHRRQPGEKSLMTPIRLTERERAWLNEHGGIGPMVHRLIRRAISLEVGRKRREAQKRTAEVRAAGATCEVCGSDIDIRFADGLTLCRPCDLA